VGALIDTGALCKFLHSLTDLVITRVVEQGVAYVPGKECNFFIESSICSWKTV
jgi:hypothetical protein